MKNRKQILVALAAAAAMGILTIGASTEALAGGIKKAAKWHAGSHVMVNWKGTWYKSTILAIKNDKYKVHYDGWGSKWDEWVGQNRIKIG